MTLSIVVVNHNGRAHLERCLTSLTISPPQISHDIVVVDNASTDGSVARVRQGWPEVRLVAESSNRGFAAANNAGIRASQGELVLLLNNDTIVPPGALDSLCARLRDRPDAGVAGPRLVDAEGRAELSFGTMISPAAELRQKVLMTLYARRFGPAVTWVERATHTEQIVDWVSGACLLVWRRDAEAIGLLDERYFIYTEDVDFCAAIRARGRHILFSPCAQVTHLRGRVRAATPRAINRAYRRSHLAFYEKHHPRWAPVLRAYLRLKGAHPE